MDKLPRLKDIRPFVSTRNACKLCSPLGASIALKGIEGCVPVIHGSQGCATYIRRYMISHYKEPVDIASSNFSEETTIFGGAENLKEALGNVIGQYKPKAVGVATTCLSETIGEDVALMLKHIKSLTNDEEWPDLFTVSTPSYQGTHMDGFHATILQMVKTYAKDNIPNEKVNVLPNLVSPADIRHLKEIFADCGLDATILPDYSDTLDNGAWDKYYRVPKGGTSINDIKLCGGAKATFEMGEFTKVSVGKNNSGNLSAAGWLEKEHGVTKHQTILPIGVKATDTLFENISKVSNKEMPDKYESQRARLLDSYADGHKYVFGKKAIVYGEEDLVLGICAFLDEIGVEVILAASGANNNLTERLKHYCPSNAETIKVMSDSDFEQINEQAHELKPDFIVGNSKGYYIARDLKIPIVRVGFPIHDRLGGQRIKHLAYEGTQELFDRIVNSLIEYKQDNSPIGYKYI